MPSVTGWYFLRPKLKKGRDRMYFFHGKLGAYERMMTEKPGFYRRAGKSGKDGSQKKPYSKKQDKIQKQKESEDKKNE
jgi:hypothetical protein